MKRLHTTAACLAVTLTLLAACGSDQKSSTTTTAAAVTTAAATESTAAGTESTTSESSTSESSTAATSESTSQSTAVAESATTTASGASTDATPAIVIAANSFLDTLSTDERSAVLFDFTDTAQRQRWSNLPEGLFTRDGLMWGNLSEASQTAWLAVMHATMSQQGYDRVLAEQAADEALATSGGGGDQSLGTQYYWVAVIGTPSETEPWQWQWGGHHVSVNATIVGPEISLTPSFIGVQPGTFDANGDEVRPLGDIEDEAFALVNSLDATQQASAILGDTLIDLVLGPGQDGRTIAAEGLAAGEMTADQQAALLQLIGHYGGLLNDEDAAARMADIEANLADTYFAWYGPTTDGSGMYFRITGPTVVIEYSGQEMGGDAADHIHGIYRDPTNDYGAALGAGLT